ncbi:MAG: glycine cleavage system protein T, partial [Candidatus Omnitrophica bacterium]|nr:glycine cleavage system protein T [Candidatus Omnitrophota bacterium]
MNLKTTPLYPEHQKLAAQMSPFGGWLMPIQYSRIIEEHNWTRASSSLFDICHMGEFIIQGELKNSKLDTILTMNLNNLCVGKCRYGFMLNERGGIIDDLVIYRIEDDRWMLVVNAATTDNDEAHLIKHLSGVSRIENISSKIGKLDIQGPLSREILKKHFGNRIDELGYYGFA